VARQAASGEAQRAIDALDVMPDNAHRSALLQLAADLLRRRH